MPIDRRQQILKVSKELFLHYGYQKVTLVDISEALGVSRPTVYQEFANKDEIYITLLEDWRKAAIARIIENRDPKADSKKQLLDAIEIWVIEPYEMVSQLPKGEGLADCSHGFAKDTMDEGYAEFSKQLETILKNSKPQGALPNKELANFISVSVRGLKGQAKDIANLRNLINSLLKLALNPPH